MISRRSLSSMLCAVPLAAIAACALSAPEILQAPKPTVVPYQPTGIYDTGQLVGWTVTLPEGTTSPYTYSLKKNNHEVIESGRLDLSGGRAKVETRLVEPAMLYLEIATEGVRPAAYAAAVAPTKLKPVVRRPKDFDAFWKRKIGELKAVPENPVVTPGTSYAPDVDYSTVQMDHVKGTHVYGQMAKPKEPGKYPALLLLQWASPPYPLHPSWVVEHAKRGFLTLNIQPHDVLPTEPDAYYQGLPNELKNYPSIGREDRETSYFVDMYLRDYRAVDYLAKCPEWDGKTIIVMGTSMGGQQSLAVAGLHPKVTHLMVNVPAGCDLNATLHGRQMGYPNFPPNEAKTMETARYVDCINFAPRIKATSLVAMGFVDTVSPPAGIWTAFNLIIGKKEAAPMVDSPHNHVATPEQQRPWTDRSAAWLAALAKGERVPPKSDAMPTPKPVERTDGNSRLAHLQLVEKARKGGIDVYFVGDSITRRWGTSDAAYKDFLANWRQNFFGWNAGNFGWGGDTTGNILWRLENGELDGVNPKVVVILVGTNDVGKVPGDDAKVAQVTSGVRAIVDTCRRKAPKATIVLTAIFPRNDDRAVVPTIERINRNLAKLADGKRVRFLNVNGRLADREGNLYEGMAVDGLHLGVKGYQLWADGLKPVLTELLGPPAATDHAPFPTGDPSVKVP